VFLDHPDEGINPCGEIKLNPKLMRNEPAGFAFCDLSEVNGATCDTKADFLLRCNAAAVIGTLQTCYSQFTYLHPRSRQIAERDRLIGVSITGIMDNPKIMDWLHDGRQEVVEANRRIADMLGIVSSERVCCIKPSGTASLLLGTSSGIHCHHDRRYLRRVTVNQTEVVGRAFATANPHMVEEKPNGDYCLVFPVQARDNAIIGVTGVAFLETVHRVLMSWCTLGGHNVSCTVPIGLGDLKPVIEYVWKHRATLSALAFAPVDIGKKYPFAPLERVEGRVLEAYWDLLIKNYTPVDWKNIGELTDGTSPSDVAACEGGKCEVDM
jgi:ribonucleoside-diphosphate reductase alpha chain